MWTRTTIGLASVGLVTLGVAAPLSTAAEASMCFGQAATVVGTDWTTSSSG